MKTILILLLGLCVGASMYAQAPAAPPTAPRSSRRFCTIAALSSQTQSPWKAGENTQTPASAMIAACSKSHSGPGEAGGVFRAPAVALPLGDFELTAKIPPATGGGCNAGGSKIQPDGLSAFRQAQGPEQSRRADCADERRFQNHPCPSAVKFDVFPETFLIS